METKFYTITDNNYILRCILLKQEMHKQGWFEQSLLKKRYS